jgi:hypothetical protein
LGRQRQEWDGDKQYRIVRDRIVDGKDGIGGRQRQEWDGKEQCRIGRDRIGDGKTGLGTA